MSFTKPGGGASLRVSILPRGPEEAEPGVRLVEWIRRLDGQRGRLEILGEPNKSTQSDAMLVAFELEVPGEAKRRGLGVLLPFEECSAVLDLTAPPSEFPGYSNMVFESFNSFGHDPAKLK